MFLYAIPLLSDVMRWIIRIYDIIHCRICRSYEDCIVPMTRVGRHQVPHLGCDLIDKTKEKTYTRELFQILDVI